MSNKQETNVEEDLQRLVISSGDELSSLILFHSLCYVVIVI